MCLISACPKGTKKYTDEVESFIKAGFVSNRDGSGIMYKRAGESFIYVKKGFMYAQDLLQAVKDANLKDEDELVIHHRFGTSGLATKENTHPFVISDDHETIINVNCKTDKPCLVHNGCFNVDKFRQLNKDFSDTYAFVRYILFNSINLFKKETQLFLDGFKDQISWSKMCVLFPDRDMILTGNYQEDNGYYHSNTGYKNYDYVDRGGRQVPTCAMEDKPDTTLPVCVRPPALISNKYFLNRKAIPVLQGSDIIINQINWDHFFYTNKNVKDSTVYEFEEYDDECIINLLWATKGGSRSQALSTKKSVLHHIFNYHPKKEYEDNYREYLLLMSKLQPSKSNIKKLYKLLNNARQKTFDYQLNINGVKASKLSYLNYFMFYYKTFMPAADLGLYGMNIFSKFNDPYVTKKAVQQASIDFKESTSNDAKDSTNDSEAHVLEVDDVCIMD